MNFSGRAVTSVWPSLDWAQLGAWQLPLCICIPVTNTDRSRRPHCACDGGNVCLWLCSVVIKSFYNHTGAGRWRLGRGPGKEKREEKNNSALLFHPRNSELWGPCWKVWKKQRCVQVRESGEEEATDYSVSSLPFLSFPSFLPLCLFLFIYFMYFY